MRVEPRRSFLPASLAALVVLALASGLAGCDQRLPGDPAERIAEARKRMDAAPTSNRKASWLVHAADNPTTAARELLLESLEAPHAQQSGAASQLLSLKWVHDDEARRRMVAYYLDPMKSARNRETLRLFVLEPYRAQYPEFDALPDRPPLPPGWVHTARGEDVR